MEQNQTQKQQTNKPKFKRGQLVFVHPLKKSGRLKSIKYKEKTVVVEIIMRFNKRTGDRTTRLMTFSLNDISPFRKRRNKSKQQIQQQETQEVKEQNNDGGQE
jgi:hypothetical protein